MVVVGVLPSGFYKSLHQKDGVGYDQVVSACRRRCSKAILIYLP